MEFIEKIKGYKTYFLSALYAISVFLVTADIVTQEQVATFQQLLLAGIAVSMRAAVAKVAAMLLLCVLPLAAQVQLMPAAKLQEFRATLPQIKDAAWHARIHDPRNLVYTDAEMPRAYQKSGSFHSPAYNISADPTDNWRAHGAGGNANVDFPWKNPGGTDYVAGTIRTVKSLLLPIDRDGKQLPIAWYQGREGTSPFSEDVGVYRWIYPVGTMFSEIIQTNVSGRWLVFEIRVRIRAAKHWDVEVFRPFPACEDLAKRLEEADAVHFASVIASLRKPEPLTEVNMTDPNNPRPGFVGKAGVAWMPVLAPQTVTELLTTTPFEVATGAKWKTGTNGVTCYAPTTDAPGQIVPVRYAGTVVGTDTESCAKCHDGVLKHARHFNMERGWYGMIRGSDQIFSFHPIEPSAISYNGADHPVRFRQSFVQAGIVERFSQSKHASESYSELSK